MKRGWEKSDAFVRSENILRQEVKGGWEELERSLRKHAYSNILKILPPKNENFQIKTSDIFHIFAQNIDCGYLLEPPQ